MSPANGPVHGYQQKDPNHCRTVDSEHKETEHCLEEHMHRELTTQQLISYGHHDSFILSML